MSAGSETCAMGSSVSASRITVPVSDTMAEVVPSSAAADAAMLTVTTQEVQRIEKALCRLIHTMMSWAEVQQDSETLADETKNALTTPVDLHELQMSLERTQAVLTELYNLTQVELNKCVDHGDSCHPSSGLSSSDGVSSTRRSKEQSGTLCVTLASV